MGQNLNLCAAAIDLATLNLGGFFDHDILGIIRADADEEIALYAIAVGRALPLDRMELRRPTEEDALFRCY